MALAVMSMSVLLGFALVVPVTDSDNPPQHLVLLTTSFPPKTRSIRPRNRKLNREYLRRYERTISVP